MNRAKTILLTGFAAVSSLLLSACGTTVTGSELAVESPLVVSPAPLSSVSYLADYSQDGALPFTCEVLMRSDDMIRRNYAWKDEQGADKKVSIVIRGDKAVKIEDGKSSDIADSSTEMARFFAGLILSPASVVTTADRSVLNTAGITQYVYRVRLADVPGVESCVVNVDPKSRLWTGLQVRMAGGPGEFSSSIPAYQTVSGVTFPAQIVSSTGDGGALVRCIVRDLKINPELPDELFALSGANG